MQSICCFPCKFDIVYVRMNHSEWKYIRRHIVKTALTVIFIIASILLIILVLMQEGKEAGLGSLTGAADSGNILEQRTKVVLKEGNTDQSDKHSLRLYFS